jgi:oxygen-independent coproporphyrinogen-3 oxidase
MAGIYIHIPFCRKACHYCNFHFSTTLDLVDDVVHAICEEASLQRTYLNDEPVTTIYFGGGTPSLLHQDQLGSILQTLRDLFNIAAEAEITLETNPDDITELKLSAWKNIGINRLSIGVQSFFETDLEWMNRAHNASQAKQSIELAKRNGFENITIDLIYGTPGLTDENWIHNIETAIELNIPHLSCYALTVEEGTALHHKIKKGSLKDVDTDHQSRQFEILMDKLSAAGYEHYEISNFAKPGYQSKHNSSYWKGEKYLGLGPSAHSYNGSNERQWNLSNNALYVQSIKQGTVPLEKELLTDKQRFNEMVMISLRTNNGLSLKEVSIKFSAKEADTLRKKSEKYLKQGLMKADNEILLLTNKGRLLADGIAADLFKD